MRLGACLALSGLLVASGLAAATDPAEGRPADAGGETGSRSAPAARFTGNGDGTVTDHRTGLVWLRDASCAELPKTDNAGRAYGSTAMAAAAELSDGICDLADGSRAGDWRLPSRAELESVLDLAFSDPALSNASGSARWAPGDPFAGVESTYYWSSSPLAADPTYIWCVDLFEGVVFYAYEVNYYFVWPVRDGP